MYVFGISGSPRKGGLTDKILDSFLDGAKSTGAGIDKIILNDLAFRPCQNCGGCLKTGVCVLKDDMRIVYDRLKSADIIVLASPIFFGSVSAQLKMMIDRFHSLWVARFILKKDMTRGKKQKGVFLCVSGREDKEQFESARKIIRMLFNTLGIDYAGELFFGGTNKKAADEEAKSAVLRAAFELGKRLAG